MTPGRERPVRPVREEVLLAIVRAYRVDLDGRREQLAYMRTGAVEETIEHRGWPDDGPPVASRKPIDRFGELAAS